MIQPVVCCLQVYDLAVQLVSAGKGDVLLTAVCVGLELRGVQSDARFLRVFEHGALSFSDIIAELIFLTSRREKGVVCTPLGHVTLERRVLAVLQPEAEKVNLAEGFGSPPSCCSVHGYSTRALLVQLRSASSSSPGMAVLLVPSSLALPPSSSMEWLGPRQPNRC